MRISIPAMMVATLLSFAVVGQPATANAAKTDEERTGTEGGFNAGGSSALGGTGTIGMAAGNDYAFESDAHGGSFTGGVQVGYDIVTNGMLFGVEVDFNALSANASQTVVDQGVVFRNEVSTDWFSTARARLGVHVDETLIYLTAGVAVTDLEVMQTPSLDGIPIGRTSRSETKLGFVVGGGLEFPLTKNMTIRGEYLYANFGSIKSTYPVDTLPGEFLTYEADLDLHILRSAINFRF